MCNKRNSTRIEKVYVLIRTWDYADDGFNIEGIFATLNALRDYVAINHAEFISDDNGNYYYKDEENKYSDYIYLTIYEEELTKNTQKK